VPAQPADRLDFAALLDLLQALELGAERGRIDADFGGTR
jgi:hypothetical protein